jgi:hypothetical protein
MKQDDLSRNDFELAEAFSSENSHPASKSFFANSIGSC